MDNSHGSCPCGFWFCEGDHELKSHENQCKIAIMSNVTKKMYPASVKNFTKGFGLIWGGGVPL